MQSISTSSTRASATATSVSAPMDAPPVGSVTFEALGVAEKHLGHALHHAWNAMLGKGSSRQGWESSGVQAAGGHSQNPCAGSIWRRWVATSN